MKINGTEIKGPKADLLILPRRPNDLVFKAQAVMDFKPFELLCPMPKPPLTSRPGDAEAKRNPLDKEYQAKISAWFVQRQNWMILTSLSVTEGLEWSPVIDMSKPETWDAVQNELTEAGFNQVEKNLIINLALSVNGVDDAKMTEARERFLSDHPEEQSR